MKVTVRRYVEVNEHMQVIRVAWKASASSKSTDYCAHGNTEEQARKNLADLIARTGEPT